MDDLEKRSIVATLLRCRGQSARPADVSRSAEQIAMNAGYLRFYTWPVGHYEITESGRELIAEFGD